MRKNCRKPYMTLHTLHAGLDETMDRGRMRPAFHLTGQFTYTAGPLPVPLPSWGIAVLCGSP
jgi:hypothetical protein